MTAAPQTLPPESHSPWNGAPLVTETGDGPGTSVEFAPPPPSLADLVRRLGGIPLERILTNPPPGAATEADVLHRPNGDKLLCELVDGVLVRKPMGYYESFLAVALARLLGNYLETHPLGIVLGEAATLRLMPGLVRMPDVSFVSWERFPTGELPAEPMPNLAPDLAVEILSLSNTPAEMTRKVQEYFQAGVRRVWLVDPRTRTACVYCDPDTFCAIPADGVLSDTELLPGFRVELAVWLAPPRRPMPGTTVG